MLPWNRLNARLRREANMQYQVAVCYAIAWPTLERSNLLFWGNAVDAEDFHQQTWRDPTPLAMPKPAEVISHWHHSVENFNASALQFFQEIEATLVAKTAPTRSERVDYHESGVLSAKREYLRVSYGRYSFDIAAFPFGQDFYFSWWLVRRLPDNSLMMGCLGLLALPVALVILTKMAGVVVGFLLFLAALGAGLIWVVKAASEGVEVVEDAILGLPIIGTLYMRFFRPVTYYSEDSQVMFEESVHRVVIDHVAALLSAKGARALAPEEAKPESRRATR